MDLSTSYMGLELKNPFVAAASPLSNNIDNYKRLEDAGISAIVNHSLFEEQIHKENEASDFFSSLGSESFSESLTYAPSTGNYSIGPDEYLKHISIAKQVVNIPIIGSLNGFSPGGWTKYAKHIEEAGADALELNIYFIPTDLDLPGSQVEAVYVDILTEIKSTIDIPVAVKVSPFFSSMANMAKRFSEAGADALVLFNRFYQPDIDLENLEVTPNLVLSTSYDMRLPLQWMAILYGNINASLAGTSGIHRAEDAIKMIMAGADVTMLCSTLLKNGIEYAKDILQDMEKWMTTHEYESVKQMKGSMSQKAYGNPELFERANYMRVLQSYKGLR